MNLKPLVRGVHAVLNGCNFFLDFLNLAKILYDTIRSMKNFTLLVIALGHLSCAADLLSEANYEKKVFDEPGASKSSVNFLVFGDSGTGRSQQFEVAQTMKSFCESYGCDFGVIVGDAIYENGVDSVDDPQFDAKFEKAYQPLGIPLYVALGNHDYRGNVQAQVDYTSKSQIWKMPERYFEITDSALLRNTDIRAKLVVIDTNDFSDNQQQIQWFKGQLSQALQVNQGWRFVFGHHPLYSYGRHGPSYDLRNDLEPLICDQVQIYFSGHEHDLQLIDTPCRYDQVVSGAAGKRRATGDAKDGDFSRSTYGFVYVRMEKSVSTIYFVDRAGDVIQRKEYRL